MNVASKRILVQLALICFFISGTLVGNARAIDSENLMQWLAVSILTALTATLTIDLAWFIQLRHNEGRPLPLGEAIGLSLLIGGVFAITQFIGMRVFNVVGDRETLVAAVSSVVTITIIGVAISRFLSGRHYEEERQNRLLEEGIAVSLVREDVTDIVHRMQVALGTDIDDALAPARRGIEERLADQQRALSEDEWAAVARELRTAAQDTVRPLSQQLWSRTAARDTSIRISPVMRNIVTRQPFRPMALALILVVTGFASSITLFGWGWGIAITATSVLTIFAILGSANLAMRRWPSRHIIIFIAASIILQLGVLLNFPLRDWQQVQPYTWAEAIAAAVIGFILILLTSGAGSLRTYRDDVARNFQSDIDREMIESIAASRQVAQLARESARILHGTVQTRLIACAVSIERASETRDADAFRTALREAHSVLAQPTLGTNVDSSSLVEEVQRKVQLWSGLCDITIDVDPILAEIQGRSARDVGRVVEEGLSNAIRHGNATSIQVRVSRSNSSVNIEVDDNGRGPQDGPAGLGSSLLDSLSPVWNLSAIPVGARLSVELAVS